MSIKFKKNFKLIFYEYREKDILMFTNSIHLQILAHPALYLVGSEVIAYERVRKK